MIKLVPFLKNTSQVAVRAEWHKPKLLTGKELEERALELGVSLVPGSDTSAAGTVLEPALQSRVIAAEAWQKSHNSRLLSIVSRKRHPR